MRVPWTARRSNQSILKEISPGISLEGMMLKLKLRRRKWQPTPVFLPGESQGRGSEPSSSSLVLLLPGASSTAVCAAAVSSWPRRHLSTAFGGLPSGSSAQAVPEPLRSAPLPPPTALRPSLGPLCSGLRLRSRLVVWFSSSSWVPSSSSAEP